MSGDDSLTKSMRRRFQYYDKDGDGRLSGAEVLTMLGDQHVSEANRSAISSMLDSLGSVDFDEFVGLWEMVTGFESDDDDESEPESRGKDEKPADSQPDASLRPRPAKLDGPPPRDAHRTPPPRTNVATPPRRPPATAAAPSGGEASSTAQMNRPPPLPGPAAARRAHPSKPRGNSPSTETTAQPQVPSSPSRTRLMTAVSDRQLEIAAQTGMITPKEAQRAKKQKKKNQGGGCCAARPKKQSSSSPAISSRNLVPADAPPRNSVPPETSVPPENWSEEEDEPSEQVVEHEREQSVPADVEGFVSPAIPAAKVLENTSSPAIPTATPAAKVRTDTSRVGQGEGEDDQWQDASEYVVDDAAPLVQRTGSSWSRNPTPPRSRPSAAARSVSAARQDEVDGALTQAQAAKDYAEQMIEAAHAAQAEAVQAARDAAAVHATAEAREAAQQLLEEAHAVSRLCCHCQGASLSFCLRCGQLVLVSHGGAGCRAGDGSSATSGG